MSQTVETEESWDSVTSLIVTSEELSGAYTAEIKDDLGKGEVGK